MAQFVGQESKYTGLFGSLRSDAETKRQICRPIINCIEIKGIKRDKINLIWEWKRGIRDRIVREEFK
jgi:hypothetical protein